MIGLDRRQHLLGRFLWIDVVRNFGERRLVPPEIAIRNGEQFAERHLDHLVRGQLLSIRVLAKREIAG